MVNAISLAAGLLALSPLAIASPVMASEKRQIPPEEFYDTVACIDGPGIPMGELDACIQGLKDRGDEICSFHDDTPAGQWGPSPAFCYAGGVRVTGLTNSWVTNENPTCSVVAMYIERVKEQCNRDGGVTGYALSGAGEPGLSIYVQYNTGAEEDWPVQPRSA